MASFRKRGDRWRAEVCVNGERDSETFPTKAEARQWASEREVALRALEAAPSTVFTMDKLFDKYGKEVSEKKRGKRWEQIRLKALADQQIDGQRWGSMKVADVTASHIARWRDLRLKQVSAATVTRELNLISHCFAIARDEWLWIKESPTTKVSRPEAAQPRDRRPSDDESDRICLALGYIDGEPVTNVSQRIAVAWLFAIETAMRCGEICGLLASNLNGPVATLPKTKNGSLRKVPLSKRALELLGVLPEFEGGSVFGLQPSQVDALFRKAKTRAGIVGLTFHDSRHEATTRLAQKLNPLELARVLGHRDLKMVMVYYNETPEALALKLG